MINTGFKLSAKDLKKLGEFKHSAAYGTYLKCIKSSPVYVSIMKEHSDKINIEEDVAKLKQDGQLPDNISPEALSTLFKLSISRMVINVIADAIILKELEDKAVDDVINGISKESNILYLTGMQDEKYYKEAQRLLENGELSRDDVRYRGLMAWMKRNDKTPDTTIKPIEPAVAPIEHPTVSKKREIDLDSVDITL